MINKYKTLPDTVKHILIVKGLETLLYGSFWTAFGLELFKHINATTYAFSDMYYALFGLCLSTVILKYKDNVINYFKLFLILDIITNIIIGIIFIFNNDWSFYWIVGCTILPSFIQKFIDIGVTRINYILCPNDDVKENVNILTDVVRNIAILLGSCICMLLSTFNIFDITIWMIFITIACCLSSVFYLTINISISYDK